MAKHEAVFIYIGTYRDETGARDDYEVVKDLHHAGGSVPTTNDGGGPVGHGQRA